MDREHQKLLAKIMSHENDEKEEPTDKLKVSASILAVEEEMEYIEDKNNNLAWLDGGRPFKARIRF